MIKLLGANESRMHTTLVRGKVHKPCGTFMRYSRYKKDGGDPTVGACVHCTRAKYHEKVATAKQLGVFETIKVVREVIDYTTWGVELLSESAAYWLSISWVNKDNNELTGS